MQISALGLRLEYTGSRSRKVWRRSAVAVGAANLVLLAGGIAAAAAWNASGTGAAAAKAGSAVAVNGTVTSTTTGTLLVPNGTAQAFVNVHNPNSFSVKISQITVTAATQPDSIVNGTTGCTVSTSLVSLSAVTMTGLTTSIAGNGDAAVQLTGNPVSMGLASDNGCQGATFLFTSTVTVTAAAG